MYYRIAEVTLCSQLELPTFDAFICEPCEPDAVLEITAETISEGSEIAASEIVCRKIRDGWFLHGPSDAGKGLIVNRDYTRMRMVREKGKPTSFMEDQYVRIALECLLARRGCFSLHAACIELDGEAIAFTGNSGMGKSTRAASWIKAFEASLVSGDRPMIQVSNPPEVYGVPWDGKEGYRRNVHLPLNVICEVRRSDTVYVRQLSQRQKQRLLVRQTFIPMWDTDTAVIQMRNIARFASRANMVRAFCGPSAEDAEKLREVLELHKVLEEKPDMKAKSGFILRNIMDDYMVLPTGDNINEFNGTLLMNEVSSFIWEKLQNPISREDLIKALTEQYDVDEGKAAADLDELLKKFREYGVIEDD